MVRPMAGSRQPCSSPSCRTRPSLALAPDPLGCAGVLAYDALPALNDVVPGRSRTKIRLIASERDAAGRGGGLGDAVRALNGAGADARATLLHDAGLTPSAIGLGSAYLAELSASALDPSSAERCPDLVRLLEGG